MVIVEGAIDFVRSVAQAFAERRDERIAEEALYRAFRDEVPVAVTEDRETSIANLRESERLRGLVEDVARPLIEGHQQFDVRGLVRDTLGKISASAH